MDEQNCCSLAKLRKKEKKMSKQTQMLTLSDYNTKKQQDFYYDMCKKNLFQTFFIWWERIGCGMNCDIVFGTLQICKKKKKNIKSRSPYDDS